MTIVLDSDLLVSALDGTEPHHARAAELFREWRDRREPLLVSAITLTEVLVAPSGRAQALRRARAAIAALGVVLQQPGELIAIDAARLRHDHPLTLADAYCLATARAAPASVATFDPSLARVAQAVGLTVVPSGG